MVGETIRGTEQNCLPPRSTFIYRFYNRGDMARKTPPTIRQIKTATVPAGTGIIDIGECLSLLNRKAFRQGMEYYVESWALSSEGNTQAYLMTLQESWINSNAWTKAFHTWIESQEQVEAFDELKGRYHDFKVFFNETHAEAYAGGTSNLLPWDIDLGLGGVAGVSATAAASWDYSEIQIPNFGASGNTVGFHMHMVGADGASKGIVAGYADSRARPQLQDPNTLTGTVSWMETAFDVGENLGEIVTDLTHENDSPPYVLDQDTAFEFYPGGSNSANGAGYGLIISDELSTNPAVGSFITKRGRGFVAPCGLVWVVGTPNVAFTITLNLALGPYKGVLARPMQDVN